MPEFIEVLPAKLEIAFGIFKGNLKGRTLQAVGFLCFAIIIGTWVSSCGTETKKTVKVFIAGSLMVPFDALELAYETQNPDVDVQVEAHGSIQCIRHVTEIHDLIDVVVPADYSLIPLLMYSTVDENNQPYADWYIKFASNRVVLAHTSRSSAADEITSENWYEILARPEVKLGLSDPRMDAAGYRALTIAQLAEDFYDDPTLFEHIFLGRFKEPIRVERSGEKQLIRVPEILETRQDADIVMRGSSVALLALLQSGDVDYAFEYESVARQHGLSFVELPEALHLGSPAYASHYGDVKVLLDYQRFSSIAPEFPGEVIGYGVTIPNNAPNPDLAVDFVNFLLGPQGAEIMTDNNHPVFDQYEVDRCQEIPELFAQYCN